MNVKDPDYRNRILRIFDEANFIQHLGIACVDVGAGWCHTGIFTSECVFCRGASGCARRFEAPNAPDTARTIRESFAFVSGIILEFVSF